MTSPNLLTNFDSFDHLATVIIRTRLLLDGMQNLCAEMVTGASPPFHLFLYLHGWGLGQGWRIGESSRLEVECVFLLGVD